MKLGPGPTFWPYLALTLGIAILGLLILLTAIGG
jgi:hypothetical protein